MVKLKRIRIDKFRNVKPGTELRFADGFNVLLGRNGTGKTTLLRLLSAAASSSFAEFEEEEFAVEYELRDESLRAFVRVENVKVQESQKQQGRPAAYLPSLSLRLERNDDPGNAVLEAQTKDGQSTVSQNGTVTRLSFPVSPTDWHFLTRILVAQNTFQDYKINALTSERFDESIGFFQKLRQSDIRIMGLDTVESPALIPYDVIIVPPDWTAETSLSLTQEHHSFLKVASRALGFASLDIQLNLKSKTPEQIFYGDLRFWVTRRDGSAFDGTQLSYGQKRLVSFLCYLSLHPQIVIADELVNGLHHDWIQLCVNEIGNRQAFLTSQNPLLMDYIPFETQQKVRESFVLCSLEYDGDKEVVVWRNMTEDEAQRVFAAGEVGIETLSTILINEGLW